MHFLQSAILVVVPYISTQSALVQCSNVCVELFLIPKLLICMFPWIGPKLVDESKSNNSFS